MCSKINVVYCKHHIECLVAIDCRYVANSLILNQVLQMEWQLGTQEMEATIIIIISYPVDCGTYIHTLRLLFLLPSTGSKFVYQSRTHRIPEETKLKEMENGRNVNLMRMAEKLFAGDYSKSCSVHMCRITYDRNLRTVIDVKTSSQMLYCARLEVVTATMVKTPI